MESKKTVRPVGNTKPRWFVKQREMVTKLLTDKYGEGAWHATFRIVDETKNNMVEQYSCFNGTAYELVLVHISKGVDDTAVLQMYMLQPFPSRQTTGQWMGPESEFNN